MSTPLERLEKATGIGEDPQKLIVRFGSSIMMMDDEVKQRFTPIKSCRFDFEKKRLYSIDGIIYLQWRVRPEPDEPISYYNQQTNRGSVSLELTEGADE